MSREYPDHPSGEYIRQVWIIRRNGKECARATTRREADRIIAQLQKIRSSDQFSATYAGANISHCGEGGKAL